MLPVRDYDNPESLYAAMYPEYYAVAGYIGTTNLAPAIVQAYGTPEQWSMQDIQELAQIGVDLPSPEELIDILSPQLQAEIIKEQITYKIPEASPELVQAIINDSQFIKSETGSNTLQAVDTAIAEYTAAQAASDALPEESMEEIETAGETLEDESAPEAETSFDWKSAALWTGGTMLLMKLLKG